MANQAHAATNASGAQTAPVASPYGGIAPVADLNTGLHLLQLPKRFTYPSFSWTGTARMRARLSAPPPRGKGMSNRSGRSG